MRELSSTKVTRFHVRDLETLGVVHTVETTKTGAALERVERGLLRKVDLDRFYVDEEGPAEVNGV